MAIKTPISVATCGGLFKIMISFNKIGDLNIDWLHVYISDQKKIGEAYLYNFNNSFDINKNTYEILSEKNELYLNPSNCFFVSDFKIYEPYRGMGYSKILLENILNMTKTYNVKYVYLNCKKNNEIALNLYKKYNFEKYGENNIDYVLLYKVPDII